MFDKINNLHIKAESDHTYQSNITTGSVSVANEICEASISQDKYSKHVPIKNIAVLRIATIIKSDS